MKKLLSLMVALGAVAALAAPAPAASRSDESAKVASATAVLNEIMHVPEQGIPDALLNNSYGVAVFPGVIKAGFGIGGRYGEGILVARLSDGTWSDPMFLKMTGGSIGWQAGVNSTDIVLVFKTRKGVEHMMNGDFTLGAQAAVAAGPIGRQAEASTDARLSSEIYSYSRSRGLFAGVAIEGAVLSVDHGAINAFYGRNISPPTILAGRVANPPVAGMRFSCTLARYSGVSQPCA